ncbi:D-alanyl-D-alanine carboxypeptidase [Candidatus Saccharibacteria bacterium]|nr:MAG: D-alanyl-D-alanine carboxypeptidase [Candidatus Saccharibacteria bacterium]
MRLVQPPRKTSEFYSVNKQPRRRLKKRIFFTLAILGLFIGVQLMRPLPEAAVAFELPAVPAPQPVSLLWPDSLRAAVGAGGFGVLATSGTTEPLATASIAKVITALCVLEKSPLQLHESGPLIAITSRDVALYNDQIQQNGSRLPVQEGMQLSEYQALQALMIPSANNIADTLVIWAFGSNEAYSTYANSYLERHGLVQTQVGSDASGLDPSTVSTASDLAKLGLLARKNNVLMEIAGQRTAVFPFGDEYENYNRVLGRAGINGLKTGNNDQNPGALLFTADLAVAGKTLQLSGAVMGAESLSAAMEASVNLVGSVDENFEQTTFVQKNQKVGTVRTAWGSVATVTAKDNLSLLRWKNQSVEYRKSAKTSTALEPQTIGALVAHAGQQQASTPLVISSPAAGPSLLWKLTRLR